MRHSILFVGYGINSRRREAIALNTNKLSKVLGGMGHETHIYNFSTEKSMLWHVLNRKYHISKISKIILKNKITHVHDVFVIPLASIIFTTPLIQKFIRVRFIKEVQNDVGYSNVINFETLARFLGGGIMVLNFVRDKFDKVFSRNQFLSKRFNIMYVPPSIDVKPDFAKRNYGNRFNVCFLGHPLKKKGLDILMDAIRILSTQGYNKKDVGFNFALSNLGDRKGYIKKINKISSNYGLKINIYGNVDTFEFFRQNDLLVLPLLDKYSAASTPNTILEAMEAGCVVATTKTKMIIGLVYDKINGLLFSEAKAQNIVRTMIWCLKNQSDLKTISSNARKMVLKKFNSNNLPMCLDLLYE